MAAIAVLMVFAGASLASENAATAKSVPFELLKTRHIVVSVKINGKGPFRMIFDTGAPFNLVNNRVARASGMVPKDQPAPLFAFLGSGGPTKIGTLELGDLKVENTQAMVMDHPTVELMSKLVSPVEGIIGYPFFARYRMTLDYQARRLSFVPNGYDPPDPFESLMEAVMSVGDNPPARKVIAPAAQWGLKLRDPGDGEPGVVIDEVFAASAAAGAGLKRGDRMLTVDDRWTDSVNDAYAAARHAKAGVPVQVRIKRGDRELELIVTPRAGPTSRNRRSTLDVADAVHLLDRDRLPRTRQRLSHSC